MKNLADFRRTVETGVDPRLALDTSCNNWLFVNAIFLPVSQETRTIQRENQVG